MKTNYSRTKIQVREMPPVVKKLIDDKAVVRAYLCGKITKAEFDKQGIKLANPL